jgi:hypothetical protein
MRYSEAQGTLIYEKNLKSKISCQTPFIWFETYQTSTAFFNHDILFRRKIINIRHGHIYTGIYYRK